jgi:hypothetical protein
MLGSELEGKSVFTSASKHSRSTRALVLAPEDKASAWDLEISDTKDQILEN